MNTQILFKDVCPQQFIGNIDHVLHSTIVTRIEQVEIDQGKSYIIVAEAQLQTFINHLKEYEASFKNLLLDAENEKVALIGLENRIRTKYQGTVFDARLGKISQLELRQTKLKVAPSKEIKRLARSVLYHMLRSYPLTSIENVVQTVCEANNKVTQRWATSEAKWIISNVEKQLLTAKTLSISDDLLLNPDELTLSEYMKVGTFLNFSSTGTGKTQFNEKLASYYISQGLTVAYISHRRTIARGSLVNEPNTTHYLEVKLGTEHSIKCLNIVVNSITKARFKSFLENVDVVILEEGKQVFEHIVLGTVEHRSEVYAALIKLCQQAKTLIVSDADLNNATLDLIKQARPHQPINYLFQSIDFSQKSIDMSGYDNVLAEIENTIGTEPVMICSDSKERISKLAKDYKNRGLRVLTITKDDANGDKQQRFCKSPDDVLHKYDVILYSPTITSSTSITKGRFKKHFGLFEGIVCSDTIIQMLRRNRPCMQFIVGIRPPNQIKETREDKFFFNVLNDFDVFSSKVAQHINFDTNNIVPALYFNAKANGFNVTFNGCGTNIYKPTKAQIKTFELSLTIESFYEGVKGISINSNKQQQSIEQWYFYDIRARMKQALYKSDITFKDVEYWYKNDFEKKLINFTKLINNEPLFKLIFEIVGVDFYTGHGEIRPLVATKLYTELSKQRTEFNQIILGIMLPENIKDPTNTVNKIIKAFGFKIKRRQVEDINKKVRVSYLCPDSVVYMHNWLDRRKLDLAA